mgnify:CR=1 FL=1
MRDRRKEMETPIRAEMDVTPLMDLTFLLLIVFMITAPMMEFGLDVTLPQLNAEALEERRTVTVTLDRRGEVFVERRRVEENELADHLRSLAATGERLSVRVRGDHRREYGEIVALMREVRDAGIEEVALITEAEGAAP